MKQITIYEFLEKNEGAIKKGWVACDNNGWAWFTNKPEYKLDKLDYDYHWMIRIGDAYNISGKFCPFNIKPFDGDWKDSLIKVKHKEEE